MHASASIDRLPTGRKTCSVSGLFCTLDRIVSVGNQQFLRRSRSAACAPSWLGWLRLWRKGGRWRRETLVRLQTGASRQRRRFGGITAAASAAPTDADADGRTRTAHTSNADPNERKILAGRDRPLRLASDLQAPTVMMG